MKNVLLTTDFSKNARNAMDYAINMFGLEDVKYTLLNSYEEPRSASSAMVSMGDVLKKESLKSLEVELAELKNAYDGIDIESKSFYGSLSTVVNSMAKDTSYDYVVLGTKGITAFESFVMGSNALDVVKSVKSPLLLVPENTEFRGLHRIAFAADYENVEQIHLLDPLVFIAKKCGAEVKVVNVADTEKPADYSHAIEGFALHTILDGVRHQYFTQVSDTVAEGLETFNKEKNIEMITMVAHKYSFFDRLFHKSVTKQVSKLADIPMLILHE